MSRVVRGIVRVSSDEHVDEIAGTDAIEFPPMLLKDDVLVQARLGLLELASGEPSSAASGIGAFLTGIHIASTTLLGLLSNLLDGGSLRTDEHELLETENKSGRPIDEQSGGRRVRVG